MPDAQRTGAWNWWLSSTFTLWGDMSEYAQMYMRRQMLGRVPLRNSEMGCRRRVRFPRGTPGEQAARDRSTGALGGGALA